MRFPEEIRFMSHVYKVESEPGFYKNVNHNNHKEVQGFCDIPNRVIKIDPDLPNASEVFFHEVAHMISYHLSLEFNEKTVELLGEGINHFLIENGLLAE